MTSAHSDELDITLDRDGELPIGVQLTWALRTRILGGTLGRGHRLPALHRLADDMGVNANTIRAVYAGLERDGLVETRHGSGTYVTGSPTEQGALTQLAATAARAARDAGVDPRDVAAALYSQTEDPQAPDDEAAARRRLRAQIAALEQAVTELSAGRPIGPAAERPAGTPARARLLTADDLREQRAALLRQLVDAQAAADDAAADAEANRADGATPAPATRSRSRATSAGTRPLPA